jgi:hypothetical protein
MLPLYLGALAFGGTLLVASIFLGIGHHDVDHSADQDANPEQAHGQGDAFGWLPITSVRFWTFFLGFGGLAGTVLTYIGGTSRPIVAVIAAGIGWVSGIGMVGAMRRIQKGAGSELDAKDLRGETAEVTVAIAAGKVGKVRVSAKGRIFDLIAETDEAKTFAIGAKVMIVGEGDEGRVQVASA